MFTAQRPILQELRAVDPKLFCVYNPKNKRWQIRLWKVAYPTIWDLKNYDLWMKKSSLCHTVCERDDLYQDVGYRRLDMRAVQTIRNSRWNEENPDVVAKEIDDHNERMWMEAELTEDEISRDCGKRLYKYLRCPSVYLGGN